MQIIDSHIVKLSAYIKRLLTLFITLASPTLFAHGVAEGDKGYIQEIYGVHVIPFIYLGAKHMVTGYDHLLFLVGIIFFFISNERYRLVRQPICTWAFDYHARGCLLQYLDKCLHH